jgi:hypothetical protein
VPGGDGGRGMVRRGARGTRRAPDLSKTLAAVYCEWKAAMAVECPAEAIRPLTPAEQGLVKQPLRSGSERAQLDPHRHFSRL